MHPDVQAKAQAELDGLLGMTRLPELDDRDSLPYCQAVLLETLRWRPALPLGVPHSLMVDDVYNGYHLPAGSLIIPVRFVPTDSEHFILALTLTRRMFGVWPFKFRRVSEAEIPESQGDAA